ncbi:unnamed protein product [Sphenostylis stenocarpa]|uniref:Uncharacterized protein n=1 Tax=Sphenostylis stenocarpa TaxID=92480 RepID=A0AA86RMB1_9FABA|nr:unnamed protein product [Sphenostylis stenocarpa]
MRIHGGGNSARALTLYKNCVQNVIDGCRRASSLLSCTRVEKGWGEQGDVVVAERSKNKFLANPYSQGK